MHCTKCYKQLCIRMFAFTGRQTSICIALIIQTVLTLNTTFFSNSCTQSCKVPDPKPNCFRLLVKIVAAGQASKSESFPVSTWYSQYIISDVISSLVSKKYCVTL